MNHAFRILAVPPKKDVSLSDDSTESSLSQPTIHNNF